MPAAASDYIIARLFLKAVLPTFAAFVDGDETARRRIEGWRFAVRFSSPGGVATTLTVRDGAVAVDEPRPGFALRLLFLSDRDVIRAFRREGTPRVLPWGGLHHLVRLPAFLDLLSRMGKALTPPTGEWVRIDRRELRLELLLGTLLPAAVVQLAAHETECRRLFAPFGDFVAQVSVRHLCGAWIRRHGNDWAWGRGPAHTLPDVRIVFRDPDTALSAIDGRLDQLAATVTGEIRVQGMIPIADALSQVMERVSDCLDQGR